MRWDSCWFLILSERTALSHRNGFDLWKEDPETESETKVDGRDYPVFQCATYCLDKMGVKAKEHGGHTATSISHQALSSAFNLLCGIEPTQRGSRHIALLYQPGKCQYLLSGMYSAP